MREKGRARALGLLVRECLVERTDEIMMRAARGRKLRGINRHGAVLAGVVHAQDAGD